jgi:hypothetical protein
VVVTALVGGINAAKSLFQSEFSQSLCVVLFPSRPVKKTGEDACAIDRQGSVLQQVIGFLNDAGIYSFWS